MLCDDSLKASAALQDFLGLQAPELLGKNSETPETFNGADALMAPFMAYFSLYDPWQCLTRASQAVSWNILDSTCFDSRFPHGCYIYWVMCACLTWSHEGNRWRGQIE
jgi:hypothetical protein